MTPKELIELTKDFEKDIEKSGIYAIYNFISEKIYIGQTKRDIGRRFREHRRHLKNGYHNNPILKNSWDKYGKDSFVYIVLENCDSEKLNEKEIYYGNLISKDSLMNCNPLGDSVPMSDSTKEKLKAKRKLRVFDESTKRKISEAHKGRVHTDKSKKNMKNGHKNCLCHHGPNKSGSKKFRVKNENI